MLLAPRIQMNGQMRETVKVETPPAFNKSTESILPAVSRKVTEIT